MSAIDQIGRPTPDHVAYAAELLARMPDRLKNAAREPIGARAAVLGLLLPREEEARRATLRRLVQTLERPVYNTLLQLLPDLDALSPLSRLPLIDLALPALRRITPPQYLALQADLEDLIRADKRIELFEWMLQRLVVRHLEPHFGGKRRGGVRHQSLRPVLDDISCLLSTLAYLGQRDPAAAQAAHDAGWRVIGVSQPLRPRDRCSLTAVADSLDELAVAAPGIKKKALEACAACIAADALVQPREAELLRAIADALDCPMPPLLPGRPVA